MKLLDGKFGGDNSGSYSIENTASGRLKISVSGEFDVASKVEDLKNKISGEGVFSRLVKGALDTAVVYLRAQGSAQVAAADVPQAQVESVLPTGYNA